LVWGSLECYSRAIKAQQHIRALHHIEDAVLTGRGDVLLLSQMDKSLCTQLEQLIETMPNLAGIPLPPEVLLWVGRAHGLVYAVLGNISEFESSHPAVQSLCASGPKAKAGRHGPSRLS
jgi:hypothetical protein